MLNLRIFILFFAFSLGGFTQDITVKGTVRDPDGVAISEATYFSLSKPENRFKTNKDGEFIITIKSGSNDTLKFANYGFSPFQLVITSKMEKRVEAGVLTINVTLTYRIWDEVVVTATKVPDTLFGTQEYSISDFEFHESGDLILLTYEKNLAKGSVLRVLDSNNQITDRYYISDEAVELRKDFRGNTHLITVENVYLIQIVNHKIYAYPENRDYFFRYVNPIVDTIGERIYFSNYSEIFPAFNYLEFDRKDSIYKTILEVEDQVMMDMYRAEFKYVDVRTKLWAHSKELETGIDKEIWVGASVFTNSIYYEPLYAPLFKVDSDSVLVFDHYKNMLFHYNPSLGFTDSVKINYHLESKKSGWEQPLIQDDINDKIYGIFQRNGYTYLSEIDRKSGVILDTYKLYFKYIESIHIIDGFVYYIYRPFESVQKKYIYREELKEI